MRIFLVRHGRSIANDDKSIHTHMADHAIPLSPQGERQAIEAGLFLRQYFEEDEAQYHPQTQRKLTRMWVSPYRRTRQTADFVQAGMGRFVTDRKENINLVEQQFGLFDGWSHEETNTTIQENFPHEYANYQKCLKFEGAFWARMPLGESRFDVARRVHDVFGTLQRDKVKHNIHDVIVIAHGISIRAFVMQWLHLPYEWFEAERNPSNCSIRLIENSEDKGYIFAGGTP